MTEQRKKILELRKLKKYFPVSKNVNLKAVEDVSFILYEGEKLGVVGESGCGKSTLGRTILQLYEQTSGSCVYYGKSIQDINPKYIQKEINHLKEYQSKADAYYKKSQGIDNQIQQLSDRASEYDDLGSAKDAEKYDKLKKQIASLEYQSKELKKDASRQLREGSRTVGSLILCKDIDAIAELFTKAENEIHIAHENEIKRRKLHDTYTESAILLDEIEHTDERIAVLEAKNPRTEQEEFDLQDLKNTKKKTSKYSAERLRNKMVEIKPQIDALENSIADSRAKEMQYRSRAFDTYRGKDILPITERCTDAEYQKKLDSNYETGINLNKLTHEEMRCIRPDLQMVFQDPAASLDPRETIGHAVEEVFAIHTDMPAAVRKQKTLRLLQEVDLKPEHYYAYPNSLSGGMKQRAGIARAIAMNPSFVVLDEAVSALDVSVQAQILKLLNSLQKEKNLTYLFITHDLGVVKHFCDRVMVMYLGNVCELADSRSLFAKPLHPYTQSLLAAVPRMKVDQNTDEESVLQGEVPSPINPPSGCPFHTRCNKCMDICKRVKPKMIEAEPSHTVACHLYDRKDSN